MFCPLNFFCKFDPLNFPIRYIFIAYCAFRRMRILNCQLLLPVDSLLSYMGNCFSNKSLSPSAKFGSYWAKCYPHRICYRRDSQDTNFPNRVLWPILMGTERAVWWGGESCAAYARARDGEQLKNLTNPQLHRGVETGNVIPLCNFAWNLAGFMWSSWQIILLDQIPLRWIQRFSFLGDESHTASLTGSYSPPYSIKCSRGCELITSSV